MHSKLSYYSVLILASSVDVIPSKLKLTADRTVFVLGTPGICTQWASCEAHCFRKHARNTNTKAARLFEIYVYTDSLLPVSLSRKFNICLIIPHFSSSFSLFPSNFNSSSFSPAKISSEIFLHELSRHFHPFSRAE